MNVSRQGMYEYDAERKNLDDRPLKKITKIGRFLDGLSEMCSGRKPSIKNIDTRHNPDDHIELCMSRENYRKNMPAINRYVNIRDSPEMTDPWGELYSSFVDLGFDIMYSPNETLRPKVLDAAVKKFGLDVVRHDLVNYWRCEAKSCMGRYIAKARYENDYMIKCLGDIKTGSFERVTLFGTGFIESYDKLEKWLHTTTPLENCKAALSKKIQSCNSQGDILKLFHDGGAFTSLVNDYFKYCLSHGARENI